MHPVIQKTFGGLTTQYLVRQYFFGALIAAMFFAMVLQSPNTPIFILFWFGLCTLLYPYSRFVYESIVGYIMGDNVFFGNAVMMMASKFFTMGMCWGLSPFIAPFGLLYLYFHHSKSES